MEYLGYVAANDPPPNSYLRRPPPPQRANSSTLASPTKKSRVPGRHRRTSSNDSSRGRLSSRAVAAPPSPSLQATTAPLPLPPQPWQAGPSSAPRLGDLLLRHPHPQPQGCSSPPRRRPVSAGRRDKELPLLPLHEQLDLGPALSASLSLPSSPAATQGFVSDANSGFYDFLAGPSLSSHSPVHHPPNVSPNPPLSTPASPDIGATSPAQTTRRKLQKQRLQLDEDKRGEEDTTAGHDETTHGQEYQPGQSRLRQPKQPPSQHRQQAVQQVNYVSIVPVPTNLFSKSTSNAPSRAEPGGPTASGVPTMSAKAMLSSEPPSSAGGGGSSSQSLLSTASSHGRPFMMRNGRTYLADQTSSYPLPVDLAEQHRQSLRSLLMFQLFGGPVCSPAFADRPPTRVLEVGCGAAFWSIMCNQYYTGQGHRGISFSGMDIAPFGLGANAAANSRRRGSSAASHPSHGSDRNTTMNWRFVQHDMRRLPWPFADEEFDLIMVKDMSLTTRFDTFQLVIDECIRLLRPGGTIEVWDADHTVRLLRPHVPTMPTSLSADEEDTYNSAVGAGAYVLTPKTPLSAPLNTYIVEYNTWLTKALESRMLPPAPCALLGPVFLQEAESLTNASSRRLAVPLSEMRWEREGVGGIVTKDGKSYIETKGRADAKGKSRDAEHGKKSITPAQSALRRTALLTVVQMIQNLEPILREVSGKNQDEWDGWSGKMMNDLLKLNGTFWGECLEVGAWWAQKR